MTAPREAGGAAPTGLAALYPHLRPRADRERAPDGRGLGEALRASIAAKVEDSLAVKRAFFEEHADGLVRMAEKLAGVYRAGGRLFTMGNGGSACDAAHVAVEFMHPITVGRPALPAHHLGAELPMATAVGNDVGFEAIFARQLEALARPGDALLGLSTSGSSPNLLAAFRRAKAMGLVTLGLAGGDGGRMAASEHLDVCLVARTDSVHRVQEAHLAAYHVLWDLTHTLLADAREAPAGTRAPAGPAEEAR